MACYEWVFTFCDNFGLSRCPLVAAPGALQALGKISGRGRLCPVCQRRQQRREPESGWHRAALGARALHPSLALRARLNTGSPNNCLCWCSTTLLRKFTADLKQGSSTHCRADQTILTWKRWAVHMWTVIHGMAWFALNCFSRDWLVSSAKYFLGEEFL